MTARCRVFAPVRSGIAFGLVLALSTGCDGGTPPTPPDADLFVSAGHVGECTRERPCGTLAEAHSMAADGQVIAVDEGRYGAELLAGDATACKAVSFRPARPGVQVVLSGVEIRTPCLTIEGLSVAGSVTVQSTARETVLDRLDISGGVYISGDRTVLRRSRVHPTVDQDAVQVKPDETGAAVPRGVIIEDNDLGPGLLVPGSDAHVDSLQVLGAIGLVVRGNLIREAASESVLLGEGMGAISGVVIEGNRVEQCRPRRPSCSAHYALYLGAGLEDVSVRGNAVMGASYVDPSAAVRIESNVLVLPPACSPGVGDNWVGAAACPGDAELSDRELEQQAARLVSEPGPPPP